MRYVIPRRYSLRVGLCKELTQSELSSINTPSSHDSPEHPTVELTLLLLQHENKDRGDCESSCSEIYPRAGTISRGR